MSSRRLLILLARVRSRKGVSSKTGLRKIETTVGIRSRWPQSRHFVRLDGPRRKGRVLGEGLGRTVGVGRRRSRERSDSGPRWGCEEGNAVSAVGGSGGGVGVVVSLTLAVT